MKQFDNAADSKKNLLTKFKNEYKKVFPKAKRCPSTILDFDSIYFQAQADKALEIEQNKLSIPLLQSTTDILTRKMNAQLIDNNGDNSHSNMSSDIQSGNSSNNQSDNSSKYHSNISSNNQSSNQSSDIDSPETSDCEASSSDEEATASTPLYLQNFRKFQQKSLLEAQKNGLFVNSDLFELL